MSFSNLMVYNGTSWDRWRNNEEVTLLASAARTATINGADQVNYNAKGLIATINVTAITATPSLTLFIQYRDPTSGGYEILLQATAITAVSFNTFIVYPGVGVASGDITQVAGFPLGRTWRVRVAHADADSATYSVGASYIL